MTTSTINGSLTQISTEGTNWITQAFPTNFHQFVKKKVLSSSETADDYKQITDTQKNELEASDAEWEEPSKEFIDAVEAAGAVYNKDTGYFELNDLTDISLQEMREIYALYPFTRIQPTDALYKVCKTRTLFPLFIQNHGASISFQEGFRLSQLESIVFSIEGDTPTSGGFLYSTSVYKANLLFSICRRLRIIKNFAVNVAANLSGAFDGSSALETVEMYGLNSNVSFKDSPKLSLESLDHMVTWRAERGKWNFTDNITVNDVVITLHPNVYAKLTPELIEKATSKQITFASA